MDLRESLNLPNSDFTIPMKADLATREPAMQKRWDEMGIYSVIRKARAGEPKFILHDGPPYTNSAVHIGTALNKSLKDFVVRYKTLRGYDAPYVPGYDTHGLPIELAVQAKHGKMEPAEMRKACRKHAEEFMQIQSEQFKRIGVLGDWEHPYATLHFKYEACIVRAFAKLAAAGYIYRDLRPTYWSITSQTALADTELVYKDHRSRAIFVRFPLRNDPAAIFKGLGPVYTLIWTTTPWTVPGNLAVAFHPELPYALYESEGAYFLLYEGLAEKVFEQIGKPLAEKVATFLGAELQGLVFKHPIFDRDSIAVLADYVTTEDGTGVVHTAPGHGHEDFYTGRKYGLPALCPVDEAGNFTKDAGEFEGKSIREADAFVTKRLEEEGNLVFAHDYLHSYPYSERDSKPVIYRTTEQWFLSVDHEDLRARALNEIQNVNWIPAQGQARITAMVEGRPDWCLSRQRIWGVGIPILYGKESGKPVLDQQIMERAAQMVESGGSDAWFDAEIAQIVSTDYKHPETGETEFRKETDVLDVWFDSGLTHYAVLDVKYDDAWKDLDWPADLYLEGSDQHRGWFNSSLITGVALRSAAPYRQVLTHGFIETEKGEKMSKSKGNAIEPIEASNKYGADILRYWAASVDYTNDIPYGEELLKQIGENYRRVRNTLRFLLANLYDYEFEGVLSGDSPRNSSLLQSDLDKWIVAKTQALEKHACERFDEYDFNSALSAIHNYCVRELSSFYLDTIKDRMYCDAKDSPARRSAQAACYDVLLRLTKLIAPILPHTAEEVYERIPMADKKATVFIEVLEPAVETSAEDYGLEEFLSFRDRLNIELESWKTENGVKDTQDVVARISGPPNTVTLLEKFGAELPIMLKLSWTDLEENSSELFVFSRSEYEKCERCRLRRPDVEAVNGISLCKRDRALLGL